MHCCNLSIVSPNPGVFFTNTCMNLTPEGHLERITTQLSDSVHTSLSPALAILTSSLPLQL